MKTKHFDVGFEIKAVNADGTVEGYGSVFGVRDNYDDVIAKGAFIQSLKDHKAAGTMPAMLWQHDADKPIGVWTEMVEDEKGLRIKGQLAMETVKGKEAHALLKMGALNGLSIGFMSKEWSYDRETEVRTLTAIDLWEVSLVTFPANDEARITEVKSLLQRGETPPPSKVERALREVGFSGSQAKAFMAKGYSAITPREAAADEALQSLKTLIDRI